MISSSFSLFLLSIHALSLASRSFNGSLKLALILEIELSLVLVVVLDLELGDEETGRVIFMFEGICKCYILDSIFLAIFKFNNFAKGSPI